MLSRHPLAPALAIASLCLSLAACGSGNPGSAVAAADQANADFSAATEAANYGTPPPGPVQAPAMTAAWNDGGSGSTAAAGPPPSNGTGMQRLAIIDPNGFEKPMPSLSLEIPAGWQPRGGVVWDPQAACGNSPRTEWRADAADGRQGIEILPTEVWTSNNLGLPDMPTPCPQWPITDVRTYLQYVVQRKRPGARILDFRERPDLIRFPPPNSDQQNRYWKQGGQVLIAYSSPAGEMRETLSVIVNFHVLTMQGIGPNDIRQFLTANSGPTLALRAPNGQLDMGLLDRISNSMQPDPQWQARMTKHNGVIAQQNAKGAADRAGIAAETSRYIADSSNRAFQDRMDTNDRIQEKTVDVFTEVQGYIDPTTGNEVKLDNRYDNAWRTSDGTYIQSNDPNLNPYVDLGVEAEQMERKE